MLPATVSPSEMAPAGKAILLVDDSADDVLLFKRTLNRAFLDNPVHAVPSVAEALQYLEGASIYTDRALFPLPSIIVIDLRIPGSDGFELLAWLRDRPDLKNLHRIVLSGVERMTDVSRAYQMGAHSFLTKPVKDEDLRNLARAFPSYWA